MTKVAPSIPPLTPLALTAKDAAALLGVSRAQLWKLHAAGKLPLPVRLGTRAPRWRYDELREWLADELEEQHEPVRRRSIA